MPLTEEAQKKIYVWGLITLAIVGALFVVFAVFLNRGTLILEGPVPFTVTVQQVRSLTCTESPCETVLAPGEYTLFFQKDGHREVERLVEVPIFGEHTETVSFEFIPIIRELGLEDELLLFAETVIELEDFGDTPIFYEEGYITYLGPNPDNGRQTLYYRTLPADVDPVELGEPVVATSFMRNLTDYVLIPAISIQKKIGVLDNTRDEGTLYMVDLEKDERNSILSMPAILDMRWIGETENFLLEAVQEGAPGRSIFYYNSGLDDLSQLPIKTSLKNVVALDDQTVLAVTSQTPITTLENPEGLPVILGELEATPSIVINGETIEAVAPGEQLNIPLSFVRTSLTDLETVLINTESFPGLPEKAALHPQRGTFLFLIKGVVYELQFEAV